MTGVSVAAVDCGTNSTRLIVVDQSGTVLERSMEVTRLGQQVDATHRLDPAAVARTVAVIRRYGEVMARHQVGRVRVVATSAVRDADNASIFLDQVEAVLGVRPEVLPGVEEARLSFAGATAHLPGWWTATGQTLVVDIGGGSTEVAIGPALPAGPSRSGTALRPEAGLDGAPGEGAAVGRDGRPVPVPVPSMPAVPPMPAVPSMPPMPAVPLMPPTPAVVSVDLGCVRVTERLLAGERPSAAQLSHARRVVRRELAERCDDLPTPSDDGWMVGLAGTAATVAMVAHGVRCYERDLVHHAVVTVDEVEYWLDRLAAELPAERRGEVGMVEGRQDVIVGGVLVLAEVMAYFDRTRCLVSEDDILDGLAASLRTG